jgi:putative methyltransferase (TIGR04325 family)
MNAYRGVYSSFAEAQRAAPPTKPLGYDAAKSEGWYLSKLTGVQLEDYPVVYWLREAMADSRTLLEVGGHVGVAYYGFARLLAYPPGFRWTIWDVPSVVEAGKALARERGRTDVDFVSNPSEVKSADIILAAGSLQYIEHPTLDELIAALNPRPRHVLLNITPVGEGPEFVTLQNIGSVYCGYRIFSRSTLVGSMERLGYTLVDSWHKPRPFRVPGHPERSFDSFSGFYFRRNEPRA